MIHHGVELVRHAREVDQQLVDWTDYFLFKEQHGDEPVEYEDGLLFPDGWQHEMDPHGLRWPPSEGVEKELRTTYWRLRADLCRAELNDIDEEIRAIKAGVSDLLIVDYEAFKGRRRWLREDIEHSNRMIRQIRAFEEDSVLETIALGYIVPEA